MVGYGLVDADGTRLRVVESGVFKARRSDPLERRLTTIGAQLRTLLARTPPHEAAVEDAFVKSDPRAALAIGHARGALLLILGEAGLAVNGYAPASIKRAVAGNGRADKAQVARMVQAIANLSTDERPADETDALAVAITHSMNRATQALME